MIDRKWTWGAVLFLVSLSPLHAEPGCPHEEERLRALITHSISWEYRWNGRVVAMDPYENGRRVVVSAYEDVNGDVYAKFWYLDRLVTIGMTCNDVGEIQLRPYSLGFKVNNPSGGPLRGFGLERREITERPSFLKARYEFAYELPSLPVDGGRDRAIDGKTLRQLEALTRQHLDDDGYCGGKSVRAQMPIIAENDAVAYARLEQPMGRIRILEIQRDSFREWAVTGCHRGDGAWGEVAQRILEGPHSSIASTE